MRIKIGLTITETIDYYIPLALKDLEIALNESYLGLGTPYQPIPVIDFITLTKSKLPEITASTKITIALIEDDDEDYLKVNPKIICCKANEVGKKLNNLPEIPKDHWSEIVDFKNKNLISAPDGTLFIAPNSKNICEVNTMPGLSDAYISYSLIFSISTSDQNGYRRAYYLILDPLLRIRSNPPK